MPGQPGFLNDLDLIFFYRNSLRRDEVDKDIKFFHNRCVECSFT